MATSQLSDFYNPVKIAEYFQLYQLELNSLIQSGVAVTDQRISDFLANESRTLIMRYVNALDNSVEPNQSSDDPSSTSTPNKLAGSYYTITKHLINENWSSMDILPSVSGIDPIASVAQQLVKYWNTESETRLIKSCQGVLADNVANDSSDMTEDIYVSSGTITASNKINPDVIIEAKMTMGDRYSELGILAVHPVVYETLNKLNLIDSIPLADQSGKIEMYQGMQLIVNDYLPVDTSTPNYPIYTSMIFGAGSVALGIADQIKKPLELESNPSAGNGAGEEILYSRKVMAVAPQGFDYSNTTSTTWANLVSSANWDRKIARKYAKIAFIRTNG